MLFKIETVRRPTLNRCNNIIFEKEPARIATLARNEKLELSELSSFFKNTHGRNLSWSGVLTAR